MRDLIRAFAKTGVGTAAALLLGMAAVKILAILVGPSGIGLFSILRQANQVAVLLAVFNGQAALVQGIASRSSEEAQVRYINVVFWITLGATSVIAFLFAAAPAAIARALAGPGHVDGDAAGLVRYLALSIIFGAASSFAMGVLNGYRQVGRAAFIQCSSYFAIAALSYPAGMLVRGGNQEAFVWLLNAGALAAAVVGTALLLRGRLVRVQWPRWTVEDRAAARHFLTIASAMMISGFVSQAVPLAVRVVVVRGFGFAGAGLFDVAWTLSMTYVLLVLTALSGYYLPTLSGIQDPTRRIELVGRVLRLGLIIILPLITTVIVFKPLVISILYSGRFSGALGIMRWMLIADYFRVLSWVFALTMLAYADMKTFLTIEVVFGGLTLAGAFVSVAWMHSLEYTGLSFLVLSVAYFFVVARYVRKRHGFSFSWERMWGPVAGLAVIVAASIATWNDVAVQWFLAIACVAVAGGVSWMLLTAGERQYVLARLAAGYSSPR